MTISQAAYRFGGADGTEATHSFLANLNTPISRLATDESTFLVRVLIQANAAGGQNNLDFQLQASRNGGAFANVTTSSAVVRAVTTAVFADAANTTSRLGGTGTFEASSNGASHDGLCGGNNFDIVASGRGECLYSVRLVAANVVVGDVITLRVLADGAALSGGYLQTPTINLTGPVTVTMDVAAAAALGGDAQAVLSATLDTAALVATRTDVLVALRVVLDAAAASASASDVPAASRTVLAAAAAAAAAANVASVNSVAVLLEAAAAGATAGDMGLGAIVGVDGASPATAGVDLPLSTTVPLDAAGAIASSANLIFPLHAGPVMVITVAIEPATIAAIVDDISAAERLWWQAFTVEFAGVQRFVVRSGGPQGFGIAA